MDSTVVLRPLPAQRTLWYLYWLLVAIVITLPLIIPLTIVQQPEALTFLGLLLVAELVVLVPVFLWIPFYHRSLLFEIDREEVRMAKGVFWKRRVTVPYDKITNVDIAQGPVERIFGVGRVLVQTAGNSGQSAPKAELVITGVADTDGVKETVMRKVRAYSRWSEEAAGEEAMLKGMEGGDALKLLHAIHNELTTVRRLLEVRGGSQK